MPRGLSNANITAITTKGTSGTKSECWHPIDVVARVCSESDRYLYESSFSAGAATSPGCREMFALSRASLATRAALIA